MFPNSAALGWPEGLPQPCSGFHLFVEAREGDLLLSSIFQTGLPGQNHLARGRAVGELVKMLVQGPTLDLMNQNPIEAPVIAFSINGLGDIGT